MMPIASLIPESQFRSPPLSWHLNGPVSPTRLPPCTKLYPGPQLPNQGAVWTWQCRVEATLPTKSLRKNSRTWGTEDESGPAIDRNGVIYTHHLPCSSLLEKLILSLSSGVERTIDWLRFIRYWSSMMTDVMRTLSSCEACRTAKHGGTEPPTAEVPQKLAVY